MQSYKYSAKGVDQYISMQNTKNDIANNCFYWTEYKRLKYADN